MKIPVRYNVRSLLVRRTGTLMTALGIGLTVGIVVVMLAMVRGLDMTFIETGDPQNLVVIRKGSANEVNSYFSRALFETVRFLPGVARSSTDEPEAAGEILVVVNHKRKDGSDSNVIVRGTSEMGFRLRPDVRIVEGRNFRAGLRELIVSRALEHRFADLGVGQSVEIDNVDWRIVGTFVTSGGAYDSEIWTGYQDVAQVWRRPIYSAILLRAESLDDAQELIKRISDDQRVQLDALHQDKYYADQTFASSIGLKVLASLIAVIMAIGSCFAVMNMMYGAVSSRQQEVATLRALGFRKRSILASFLVESAVLALIGGAVGCLLGSLFNGYSAGTANLASFSEVVFNFRVTPDILLLGMVFALFMGLVGGLLPARRASKVRLIDVLRQ
ncbi:MAG: ABC transporter permease [Acidobacteriota bacterium]|jgi:putative ABC transport system permease protein